MQHVTNNEIMHWTDWDHVVQLARSIDASGDRDKMYEVKGSIIIELCELVSNNGQGIYHWMDEIEGQDGH
jgi:hypothetical protein